GGAGTVAGGLAGCGGWVGLFLGGAGWARLALALARTSDGVGVGARLSRAGGGLGDWSARAGDGLAGGVGGDLGLDVGQRVFGVLGEPSQVAGRLRDAVAGPVPAFGGLPGVHVAGAVLGGAEHYR